RVPLLSNDPASTPTYTLSLHDALPIYHRPRGTGAEATGAHAGQAVKRFAEGRGAAEQQLVALDHLCRRAHFMALGTQGTGTDLGDRKSTRLNSSHVKISYAVFCLKKKK